MTSGIRLEQYDGAQMGNMGSGIMPDSPYMVRIYGQIQTDYCFCRICGDIKRPPMGVKGNKKLYFDFLMLLNKYRERFDNLPPFELAESLFDDCFKNKITGSE